MFWEDDEELKDMSPLDLLEILGKELNFRQKAKLNEMAVKQLKGEKAEKCKLLLEKLEDCQKKQKEINKLTLKLRCIKKVN